MRVGIDELRGMAVVRSLFRPTTLGRALRNLGFVQADPIRAPARSQDLTLRQSIGIIAWVSVFGTEKRRYGKFHRGPVGGPIGHLDLWWISASALRNALEPDSSEPAVCAYVQLPIGVPAPPRRT